MIDGEENTLDKIFLQKAKLLNQKHILKKQLCYPYKAVKKETCL